MNINIEEALKIPGFMNGIELGWLATQAKQCVAICEIGCWKGRTTRAFLDNCPAEGRVFAVDTWDSSPELKFISDNMPGPDALYSEFMANASCGSLNVCRMTSRNGAKYLKFLHEKFSMIFIDGDHTYEAVKQDIEDYRGLLFKGGLLCGHDYQKAAGVKQAVDEAFPEKYLPLEHWGDIWAVTL